ncbi:MAG: Fic family protein [Prevotella sp.]
MYIHERKDWTDFRWDADKVSLPLEHVSRRLGILYGRLANLGLDSKLKTMAESLTHEVVYSSEIEGVRLNADQVRSSIARKLGIENVKYTAPSYYVDGVVNVMLDAVEHYDRPVTKELICGWQSAFFPAGLSEGSSIETGKYRTHEENIVSGMFGREKVHYVAPSPDRVEEEMDKFISWFNSEQPVSYLIRSAIAHFWFVSIHPFEDGNGRMARILSDMMLARGDQNRFRYYNVSMAINKDKNHYYDILEKTQHGEGDLTEWILWYMKTIDAALDFSENNVNMVLNKSVFWQRNSKKALNPRQSQTLNVFLDGYESKITTKTWAALNKCSKDTALRDLQDLLSKDVVREDFPGAKRPSYSLVYTDAPIVSVFKDVSVSNEKEYCELKALFRDTSVVHVRIQPLDADRYLRGDLPLENLLEKYCAYLAVETL